MKFSIFLCAILCIATNRKVFTLGDDPTARPSSNPTTQPTPVPTDHPTTQPTPLPTDHPTTSPSHWPTPLPSEEPTPGPSILVTSSPTTVPTRNPTAKPTRGPTCRPTKVPTALPTASPSADPSASPSATPTFVPSAVPSALPTPSPSAIPTIMPTWSMYPTSMPTSVESVRHISCGQLYCEGDHDGDCYYTTRTIVLECESADKTCAIHTGAFSVGPDTTVIVNGGCELAVTAAGKVTVNSDSALQGASISITSTKDIVIFGTIDTSGGGPLDGPGAPASLEDLGNGGSYGGSGGRSRCSAGYFSNTESQIGSIDLLNDLNPTSANYAATFGSGGGFPGGGQGGGRIVLKTVTGSVIVHPEGRLSADGSTSTNGLVGAGSGGSISISASQCVQKGFISARGASAHLQLPNGGGAGGGGRVSIIVTSLNSTSHTFTTHNTNITVAGGHSPDPCKAGASGTAFVQLGVGHGVLLQQFRAAVWVANANQESLAVTALDTLPAVTNLMSISEGAVATSTQSLRLMPLSACGTGQIRMVACSIITIVNASYVALSNVTDSNLHSESSKWYIAADEVNVVNSKIAGSANSFYSFNITATNVDISENATVHYSGQLVVNVKKDARLVGDLIQVPGRIAGNVEDSYNHRSLLSITAGDNVAFGNIVASNLKIRADSVNFIPGKVANSPAGYIPQACQNNISLSHFTCFQNQYIGTLRYNNTYVIVGKTGIGVAHNTRLEAAQVLLCAPNITIESGAAVSANQRGCVAGHGLGAGGPQSPPGTPNPYGAGGAGYGAAGGHGYYAGHNEGRMYVTDGLSSGSGGGCYRCNRTYSGAGGGIINIVADQRMVLNGNLTANGGYGSENAGGGSGGTVSVNSLAMSGKGTISVTGGSGGSGKYPGGGGGGGVLTIFNTKNYYLSYNYVGIVSAMGGQPGHPILSSESASSGQETTQSLRSNAALDATVNPNWELEFTDDYYYTPAAQAGGYGILNLPKCPPGYGNDVEAGTVCGLCPEGTYAPGDGKNQCYECRNKPKHSYYDEPGWTNADCSYECDSGYSTKDCYTPFQNFVFNTLGTVGITCCAVGLFAFILLPMVYYRYKKEYGWFEHEPKAMSPADTFMHVDYDKNRRPYSLDRAIASGLGGKDRGGLLGQYSVDNPLAAAGGQALRDSEQSIEPSNASSGAEISSQSTGMNLPKAFQRVNHDLRLRFRLVDPDLVTHACRVNLLGTNHPDEGRGGQWRLPLCRPACLRPMLRKQEYRELAERINKRMAWRRFGWEMTLFYFVGLVVPPLAALLMRQFRKRRGNRLLKLLANYDYACFRCPQQRLRRDSLRVGISPDATLAYIDFLFDEEKSSAKMKPLCPLGQVKLPASFQMAGLGTYFSPYFIDTNDLILQAVPQTDIPSSFINTAWISFIVELNTVLRTVHMDSLYFGIRRLIRFLSDPQHVTNLGGLVVEFCTFPNEDVIYPSEEEDLSRSSDVLAQHVMAHQAHGPPSGRQPSRRTSAHQESRRTSSWERWIMRLRHSDRSAHAASHGNTDHSLSTGHMHQSVDMAFSSPQLSVEHHHSEAGRQSFLQTSGHTVSSCFSYFLGCLIFSIQFCFVFIWHCGNPTVYLDDPVGATLSFLEMCEAIRQGKLKMGIVVTHPKVAEHTYQVQDDDYESDDDASYQDDVEPREAKLNSVDSASVSSVSFNLLASDGDSKVAKPHLAAKVNSVLRRAYGDKAEEVARFYNIMVAADSSMAATSKDASSPTSAGQPSGATVVPDPLTTSAVNSEVDANPQAHAAGSNKTKTSTHQTAAPTASHLTSAEEYTDLSPFRNLRRGSKATRDSMLMNPRTSDYDMSTDGRLTDDRVSQFEPFHHDGEEVDEEVRSSGSSAGSRPSRASRTSRDSTALDKDATTAPGAVAAPTVEADDTPAPDQRKPLKFSHFSQSFRTPPLGSPVSGASRIHGNEATTQITPVALDRKSVVSGKKKRSEARRNRKDLSTENLATSAYQHPVNVWRLNADQEFVSDGLMRAETAKWNERSISGHSAISSVAHSAAGNEDRLRMASVVVRAGDRVLDETAPSTPLPQSRTPTIGSPPARVPRSARAAQSPWYNIRAFLGAPATGSSAKNRTNSSSRNVSISESRSQRTASDVPSDINSVLSEQDSASQRSGQASQDLEAAGAAELEPAEFQSRDSQIQRILRVKSGAATVGGFRPFYFLRLMLFYLRNFMLGSNAYPLGPAYVRNVMELLIFILCIGDFAVTIVVLTSAYCASDNTTDCKDHTSMILMLAVWPGALFIAPLMGLVTVVLGPSGTLARIYSLWSRIACINSGVVLWSLLYYFTYYYNVPGSIYGIVLLPSSRLVQCLIVDQYIAHIERLRFTRGWDGLHTSLYKTKDNLQEVTI